MNGGAAYATAYVGVDRRQDRRPSRESVSSTQVKALGLALVLVGLGLPVVLAHLAPPETAVRAQSLMRGAWSILFMFAGLFRLLRWRMTGMTRDALLGASLFCYGVLAAPTSAVLAVVSASAADRAVQPILHSAAGVAAVWLAVRALRAAPVDSRVRPLRIVATTIVVAWLVLALAMLAATWRFLPRIDGLALAGVLSCCGMGWAWCAIVSVRSGHREADASSLWTGLGLAALSCADLTRVGAALDPHITVDYATGLHVVVALLALANAAADFAVVTAAQGNRMTALHGTLAQTEATVTAQQERDAQRLHDARSLLAALKAAAHTLERYHDKLDTRTKRTLRSTLMSELERLEAVLEDRRTAPVETFRLDKALAPVLAAERRQGLRINNQLGQLSAVGRPLEFATVVQNLLANARRTAPDGVVTLRARSAARGVEVLLEDRTTGLDGQSLALYLTRGLMREQNGDIMVRARDGGGTSFALLLRAPGTESDVA